MRISGLASGLDIDSMVKQLMTAEKVPLNKLNQQKQLTEWKREGYRTVSTTLVSLNEKLSTYSLSSSINSKQAAVSGAPNVLTATASGASSNSVFNINVDNLATATTVISSGLGATASNTPLSSIYSGSEISVKINDVQIDFDSSTDTIASFVSKINSSKAAVTAVYDDKTGKMSLTNKATGDKAITMDGELLDNLFSTGSSTVQGQDATVTINGLETTQSSNRFTLNGVEITLTGVTPAGQTTQIEVSQNIDKMVETIKSFVESYNSTLATLNSKTSEERYRTYLPLTTEQKEAMSDDEVKLWETKAKSGMLKNDSIVDKTISDMRSAMISDVVLPDGTKINMTQIGITTGNYSEKGKLLIDETKLRAAIEANPDNVSALFGQTDSSNKTDFTSKDGIFNRLKKVDSVALTSLYDKAGTSQYSSDLTTAFIASSQIGEQLRDIDNKISNMNSRLTMLENRYYAQFTAMEKAMNQYNSTSSSLTSMLS